ncbi:MAG: divergent polysaccharide deacetylase family protein [Desulfobacterales bacterium]|nr:divergent polysaccharide deacetylase family protein [Desulfobacterales bacterium]
MAKQTDSRKKKTDSKKTAAKKTPSKKSSQGKSSSGKTAAKKSGSAKSGKSSGSRKKGRPSSIKWEILLFAGILAAVALAAGYYHLYFKTAEKPAEKASVEVVGPRVEKTYSGPDFEVFPKEPEPSPPPEKPLPPEVPERRPKVTIIIDDLGYEKEMAEKFLSLECPLTYSILPRSPFQKEIAERAHRRGCQVMLHLPMEPREYPGVDPGPGALLSEMSPDERIRILKENLDAVPHIKGVNNHMGSRMTANSAQMNQILLVIKKKGLFYIDSRTTSNSRSLSSARLFKVPFAERDVFLDHVPQPDFIRKQLERLVAVARKNGSAVGIAHPYTATYQVLAEELPALKQKIELVPASEVVSVRGS